MKMERLSRFFHGVYHDMISSNRIFRRFLSLSSSEQGTELELFDPRKGILGERNYLAKRSLGQNFLFDMNVTNKIAKLVGDLSLCHIIEIGPGPGSLTKALLSQNPFHLTAIEKDERFITHLTVSSSTWKA
jgi:hypothetical protein